MHTTRIHTHTHIHRHIHINTHINKESKQMINLMETENRNNRVYNQVQETSFRLRREERRSRTFEGMQPRQLSFGPDTSGNCYVPGTRVANILDEIRDGMEGLQSSPVP